MAPPSSAQPAACAGFAPLREIGQASLDELIQHADCLQAAGHALRALDALSGALALATEQAARAATIATLHSRRGQIYAGLGDYQAASAELVEGLVLAEMADDELTAARLLNDLGGVHAARGEPLQAIAAFFDSLRLAGGEVSLRLTADANLARALAEADAAPPEWVLQRLAELGAAASDLDDSTVKVSQLLSIAELLREVGATAAFTPARQARRSGYELNVAALNAARELADRRLLSFAYGYLGRLYEDAADYQQALIYTRQAALLAQEGGGNEGLYRWEWQAGRLLVATGQPAAAVTAYAAAIDTLGRMGATPVTSQRRFQQDVAPLYSEYANLVLSRTANLAPAEARAARRDVQAALEQFKVAEVQNYFDNQCVVPETLAPTRLPGSGFLVVYPVLFDDRLELLVSGPEEVQQFTVEVGLAELTQEIRLLRAALEVDTGREYLSRAQRLYSWLIEPLAVTLDNAAPGTLVIVPDGPLRTVPFSVLHDGERFLVERYALSVTPGLSLIGAAPTRPVDARVLANGIVEPVQGFAGLPYVASELASIQRVFPARTYTDDAFLSQTLEDEILVGGYSIVHMATHAQFEADYRRSFLLAYDDLITMDQLEDVIGIQRYTDQPVDLLVLSACQTAAGDERAALGLAGVAVKAGARSVLASLWLINDASTAMLVAEFYEQLVGDSVGKAQALRGAQLRLINDAAYGHPMYWAPFLMIGDWR